MAWDVCNWEEMGFVCLKCFSEELKESVRKSGLAEGLIKTP